MGTPVVTVITATYNQAGYIRTALNSLRAQTLDCQDFEVIVINDGSTDGTSEILHAFKDWIRLVEHENRGLIVSCNEGLELARGRYFARLDSDDFVAPEWLQSLLEAMLFHPDACCAFPDRYEINAYRWQHVRAKEDDLESLVACGTMFQTDIVRNAGGFRPFYWEEYDLYLRLQRIGSFVHVPRPLYMYRKHRGSMTADPERRLEGWRQLIMEWGVEALRSAGLHHDLENALRMLSRQRKPL